MNKRYFYIAIFCLLHALSCDRNLTGPEQAQEGVRVTVDHAGIEIINNSSQAIGVTAFNVEILPLILWAPICNEKSMILPKQRHRISVQELSDYKSGAEFVVYWWVCPWEPSNEENIFSQQVCVP